jgi:hypothetical protein
MSFEAVTQMARAKKPEKLEKSQEELRAVLEQKLASMKPTLQDGAKEYEQALKDEIFDDQPGEPAGAGEARKEALQKKLTALFDRAEKLKAKLDSGEEIPQATPEVSATYTHPDGKKETISLDFEQKLQEFLAFYQKNNITPPHDFEDTVRDLWEKNQTEIEQAIEQNGFDELLIIPGGFPLTELKDKLTMESGYWESSNFKAGNSFAGAKSQNTDKSRIILVHKNQELTERPELASTLNIKGQDVKLDQTLTLEDYLVFQKKYFEETNKHLDETKYVWLATKAGARLVNSYWSPSTHRLNVNASDLANQNGNLGVRPARCFF